MIKSLTAQKRQKLNIAKATSHDSNMFCAVATLQFLVRFSIAQFNDV